MLSHLKNYSLAAGILSLAVSAQTAEALSIDGTIDFTLGALTTDTGNINTANVLTFNPGTIVSDVIDPTGDYLPVAAGIGVAVTMAPSLVIDPIGASANPLWTFAYLGVTYSFTLSAVTVVNQAIPGFLNVSGTGFTHITGYDSTPGVWNLTVTTTTSGTSATRFAFNSSTAAVPDEGNTALFLGMTLTGLGMSFRRREAI